MTAIEATPRRWDMVVRVTHWSIVGAILANALVTEAGSAAHVWVGYGLAAVLGVRLVWGVVGPRAARFAAFPPSPRRAIAHVGDIVAGRKTAHVSHNPLGALMVYAIWATLGVVIATGIAMAGLPRATVAGMTLPTVVAERPHASEEAETESGEAGEAGEAGEREEGPLGELHEAAVNLLYLLIVLHIAGVIFETRRSGRDIVMAMLPRAR